MLMLKEVQEKKRVGLHSSERKKEEEVALQKKVLELEERIAQLEQRNAQLEQWVNGLARLGVYCPACLTPKEVPAAP